MNQRLHSPALPAHGIHNSLSLEEAPLTHLGDDFTNSSCYFRTITVSHWLCRPVPTMVVQYFFPNYVFLGCALPVFVPILPTGSEAQHSCVDSFISLASHCSSDSLQTSTLRSTWKHARNTCASTRPPAVCQLCDCFSFHHNLSYLWLGTKKRDHYHSHSL